MHSRKTLRLRLNFTMLLLAACAGCIGVSAQAGQKASGKIVSQPVATSSDAVTPQTSYTLAGILDNDDCEEDYVSQLMLGGRNAITLTAATKEDQAAPAERASQAEKRALSAARPEAPAPAPVTVAPSAPTPAPAWEIALTDKTLNAAIARWTTLAGWQLLWELPVDYIVEARTVVPGTFEEAVEIVAKSMETAEIPMKVIFYKGNKVLRIVPRGVK